MECIGSINCPDLFGLLRMKNGLLIGNSVDFTITVRNILSDELWNKLAYKEEVSDLDYNDKNLLTCFWDEPVKVRQNHVRLLDTNLWSQMKTALTDTLDYSPIEYPPKFANTFC